LLVSTGKKLTSSATFLPLERLKTKGKLIERSPVRSTLPLTRHLYVTPEIAGLLDGSGPQVGFPEAHASVVTDRYMIGHLICVSLSKKTNPTKAYPELERMEGIDEAWIMCFRKPRPGWRLLGRFFALDHFVALGARDRHALGRQSAYESEAQQMIQDWIKLFGVPDVHRGTTVADYLSGVWRDVSI
jgi:hypothetical protein